MFYFQSRKANIRFKFRKAVLTNAKIGFALYSKSNFIKNSN